MKASPLFSDMKAWLYFGIGCSGALAAVPELPWYVRAGCTALSSGLLAVKAYTSPPDAVPAPAIKTLSPEGPAMLPPELQPPVK